MMTYVLVHSFFDGRQLHFCGGYINGFKLVALFQNHLLDRRNILF
jgi:hypothetical protein